jgi:hypothetical protein
VPYFFQTSKSRNVFLAELKMYGGKRKAGADVDAGWGAVNKIAAQSAREVSKYVGN